MGDPIEVFEDEGGPVLKEEYSGLTEADVKFVKDLVTLFFQENQQGLEQRIADLEMLVGAGVQKFSDAAQQVGPESGEVPWYEPGRV